MHLRDNGIFEQKQVFQNDIKEQDECAAGVGYSEKYLISAFYRVIQISNDLGTQTQSQIRIPTLTTRGR